MDNIDFYSFLPLLGSIANISLSLLVYRKDKKNPVNITFALSNLCLAVWNFSFFKIYSTPDKASALLWDRLLQPGLVFVPPLFLHFVLVFTQNFTRRKKILVLLAYVLSFGLALIAIYGKGLFIKDLRELNFPWRSRNYYYPESGPFSYLFNLMYALSSIYGCYLLFKEYRVTKSAVRKNQIKYLLLGVSIGLLGGMSNILVVTSVIKMYPVGNMTIVLYSLLVTYAIIKYRLMEIQLLLKRGVIYLATFAFAIAVFFLILQFSMKVLGQNAGKLLLLELCLVVTTFVFVLLRLYPKMYNSVGWVFSPAKSDSITRIEQLGNQILSKTGYELSNLMREILNKIAEILDVSGGCVFLFDANTKKYSIVCAIGSCNNNKEIDSIPSDNSPLIDTLSNLRVPIVKEELELSTIYGNSEQNEKLLSTASELDELRTAVCIPLVIRNQIIGLLNLGPKKFGTIFAPEELNQLTTLGSQIAIALDNARLLKESRNREKEQKTLSLIASEIMAMHNPEELKREIFTHIGEIIRYDKFLYLRWHSESQSLVLEHAINFDDNTVGTLRRIPFGVEKHQDMPNDESGRGFHVEQVTQMVENYLAEQKIKRSEEFLLTAPLLLEGKLYGILGVFRQESTYSEEEKRLLQVVGSQIVVLYERMTSTLARAETSAMTRTLRQISHDMRHAFGILRGSFELLQMRLSEMSETDQQVTSLINSEVTKLDMLLTELRSLTSEEKIRLHQEDVNVALNSALQMVASRLSVLNIEVMQNLQPDVTMFVLVPAGQLTRIFFNLLLNAIEAMPQGGMLKLTTKLKIDQVIKETTLLSDSPATDEAADHSTVNVVEINISDTGCGISDKDLDNIFKPGFSTKESSGLGLAEVKRIINTCDGDIEVHSEVGAGTNFVIQLPCYRHL